MSRHEKQQKRRRIARNIKRLRVRRGMTRTELARQCGTALSYAWLVEYGERLPRPRTLQKLAKVLGVQPTTLLRA